MKVTILLLLSISIGITIGQYCNYDTDCISSGNGLNFCHPDKRCREFPFKVCKTNGDCGADYSLCSLDGRCVKCLNDNDCPTPIEEGFKSRCVDKNYQCLHYNPATDCADQSDCPNPGGNSGTFCRPISMDGFLGTCDISDYCNYDFDCTLSKDKPHCDNWSRKCVPCQNVNHCYIGFSTTTSLCRDQNCVHISKGRCFTNTDCGFSNDGYSQVCKIDNGETLGTCVECSVHGDCPLNNKPVCNNNKCEPCSEHSHCQRLGPRGACLNQYCISIGPDQCVSDSFCPPQGKPNLKKCNIPQYANNQQITIGFCELGCIQDSDCPLLPDNPRKTVCANGKCIEGCLPDPDNVLTSVHCKNASLPRCNTFYDVEKTGAGICDVECRTNFDCRFDQDDALKAVCVKGKCINPGCKVNADCHVNVDKPTCNLVTQECRACVTAADCTGNPAGPKCVGGKCKCQLPADCSLKGQGNVCNVASGVCSCLSNTDCKVANLKACTDSSIFGGVKTCGNCSVSSDCSADGSSICSYEFPSPRCVSVECKKSLFGSANIGGSCGCRNDSDCTYLPNTPACDCVVGKCVSCITDIHCANHQRCSDAKICVSLKCTHDVNCHMKEMFLRGKPSYDTRCSDGGICVPVSNAIKCVRSIPINAD